MVFNEIKCATHFAKSISLIVLALVNAAQQPHFNRLGVGLCHLAGGAQTIYAQFHHITGL